ncbi:MAG: hypothetical protein AB8H86_11150 [Polyangiales bacterium]
MKPTSPTTESPMMTDQEHTLSLRKRLEETKLELKAQDSILEDLEALIGRKAHGTVAPAQMRAAEAAFDKAIDEAVDGAPPAALRTAASREELLIPSFALFV